MEYKQNTITPKEKERFFIDLLIDGIMKADTRFKNRESVFFALDGIVINYENWLNIGVEVNHFLEVRALEAKIKRIKK